MIRVLYLHGFASGPGSRKATFFRENLARLGVPLEVPDLAEGKFSELTITRQLHLLEGIAGGDRIVLIGSSLGGYLAALYAARHPEAAQLVLLAPAFNFHSRWAAALGPAKLQEWNKTGSVPVYHYAEGREVPIGYQLMEDAEKYEPFPDLQQPCLIFHGTNDEVVPVEYSERFAKSHPHVSLIRLQSGHELTDVLGDIWEVAAPVLLGAATG